MHAAAARTALLLLSISALLTLCANAFCVTSRSTFSGRFSQHRRRSTTGLTSTTGDVDSTDQTVSELLKALDGDGDGGGGAVGASPSGANERTVSLVESLEDSYSGTSNNDRFAPLLGLYAVSAVLPSKPGDNPVGGKWTRKEGIAQKLLRTRATYQHLLPVNSTGYLPTSANYAASAVGEAVNVISLEALFGLIRLNVILRGDAIPLSNDERKQCEEEAASRAKERGLVNKVGKLSSLTVRAKFDPPRIAFGRKGKILNLNLGPRSSVVLDTTYCDDKVRVGKGGTSGTKFVFRRLRSDDEEPNEWRPLLARRPLRKSKALIVLGSVLGWGIQSAVRDPKARVAGISISAVASIVGAIVVFSSGGIEQDN
mmetsp:Transcript_35600/g.78020  ORF Transcript_35600/g.78020 Transcript_35600/m.78020 type:complete len:371 (-) Transcript_35600:870-1982(-)